MTRTPLENAESCLRDCVEMSNWYYEDRNWKMAEHWHLKAVEWQQRVDRLKVEASVPVPEHGPLSEH